LVAAAIDYDPLPAPLPGSITRQIHAQILSKRRQALNLEPPPEIIQFPISQSPAELAAKEAEEGVIIIGRSSLKEYLEGLRRGWEGGVGEWDWEKEIEGKIAFDGVFDAKPEPVEPILEGLEQDVTKSISTPAPTPSPASSLSGLGFLSKPQSPIPPINPTASPSIPSHYHTPPTTLPPHPPLLLIPFTNHLGFKQFPYMIYTFFTEHHRVRTGAEAALALIQGPTREFTDSDLTFNAESEAYYPKWYKDTIGRTETARKDYYTKLEERLKDARAFANGEREMTKVEEKNQKVTTENDLREERRKRELRWMGTEDGFEVVKPDSPIAWEDKWRGWLKVYDVDKVNDAEYFGQESLA
jgi:import inner membrane translocase subunit TIM54